jgi:hypothetical protein
MNVHSWFFHVLSVAYKICVFGYVLIFLVAKFGISERRLIAVRRRLVQHQHQFLPATLVTSLVVTLAVVWALRAFPNSADEYIYLYQAKTFLAGRLWNPLPPHHYLFTFLHIFEKEGKWVGQYPPGWPAVLAVFGLLRLPYWIADPLVGMALLWVSSRLGMRCAGPVGKILAPLLMAFTPFFVFNSASYFTSTPTALAGSVFCLAALRFIERPTAYTASATGSALGVIGLIRTYDAFVFVAPFALFSLFQLRREHYFKVLLIGLGGLPFLCLLLLYQRAITGSALLPVTRWGYPLMKLGLHPTDQFGDATGPELQLCFVGQNLLTLADYTSSALVMSFICSFCWKLWRRTLQFYDLIFPTAVVGYFFLEGLGGNRYGPRYYFPAFPMLILTITTVSAPIFEKLVEYKQAALAEILVLIHLFACAVGLVAFAIYFRGVVDERMEMYDQVRVMNLHHAIVIVHSGGGRYMPFTPEDLTRNGLSVTNRNDVIYAREVKGGLAELRGLFPDRAIYIYARPGDAEEGKVRLLEPAP